MATTPTITIVWTAPQPPEGKPHQWTTLVAWQKKSRAPVVMEMSPATPGLNRSIMTRKMKAMRAWLTLVAWRCHAEDDYYFVSPEHRHSTENLAIA